MCMSVYHTWCLQRTKGFSHGATGTAIVSLQLGAENGTWVL